MHRLGDVVDVRLVEAAPVAGALRFELLSEGRIEPRGRRTRSEKDTKGPRDSQGKRHPKAHLKSHPGRTPRKKTRKPGKGKSGQSKSGRSKSKH
jgi:ribonuclease R